MKRIAVIGLGTLGGAICKHISEMEVVDELVLIDYDVVESKNTKNSVYTASQIGETKVDALKELIKENINVIPITKKYKEGRTKIPECDLVIDCRDVVCNRGNEIDVRMYITGKILIVDCRKNVKTQYNYSGGYRQQLTKSELNKAGFFASQIICSDEIKNLIESKSVQRIDLNLLPSIINEAVEKSIKNRVDIIYEQSEVSERLHCLEENINPILNINNQNDIPVFIGERQSMDMCLFKPYRQFDLITRKQNQQFEIIPKNSLKDSGQLIEVLTNIVKKQSNIMNFIVTLNKVNGEYFVELLEETGAA